MRYWWIVVVLFYAVSAVGQTVVTYSRKNSSIKKTISFDELKTAFELVSRNSLNVLEAEDFVQNYVKYKVAVNEAYRDQSLVQSRRVESMIINPTLKESFNQLLYNHTINKLTTKQAEKLISQSTKLSKSALRKMYKKNPYYQFQYIVVNIPDSKKGLNSTQKRVNDIYNKVKKEKDFLKAIQLYSDNRSVGQGLVYHAQNNLHPTLVKELKRLKPNQLSRVVQTSTVFFIVKMIQKISFKQIGAESIRQQHFSINRDKAIDQYLKKVLSKYKVDINKDLVRSL